MQSTFKSRDLTKSIRAWLIFFMATLFLSGLTAIPLEWEMNVLSRLVPVHTNLGTWIDRVLVGLHETGIKYPFLFYGYDWLAFAHFILALLFIGPYLHPVRNKWVIQFGMIACLLIIPYALIAGHFRGIPLCWRVIDCSFGVLGIFPLAFCHHKIRQLEILLSKNIES
jgi:hypothetical protein